MGYDVHITRAENWADNAGHEITDQEWLEIIRNDPELIPSPENGKYFVVWRGADKYPETWFNCENGNISTKYPDRATFKKLYQIAQLLNANIQGDDGETYGENEIDNFDDSFLDSNQKTLIPKKSKSNIFSRIIGSLKK
jgi:hypothetical protein